jgi:superfamily II DNA or RNA helicase
VVSERAHIDNWIEEYYKIGKEHLLENTQIFCYASLKNYVSTKVGLLGLDEVHHSSELRLNYLETIKAEKVVGMTATINLDVELALKRTFGAFKKSVITLTNAIENGWVQDPRIILIPLSLRTEIRTQVHPFKRGKYKGAKTIRCIYPDRFRYMKFPNVNLEIECSERERYELLSSTVDYYSGKYRDDPSAANALKLKRAGLIRKNYLSELKTEYVHQFINSDELIDKKYICFCGSITQAEMLGGEYVLHSKLSNPERILAQFKEGVINKLFTVKMLKEGVNIPNIHSCIITQLDSKERDFIQKVGRALRNPNDPMVYVFFFKDTKDEDYLATALQAIDGKYVQWI